MNHELSDVQAGFRKGTETRDQIANICWIIKNAREFQENIYFCFIDYTKAFDYMDHNKLWKIPQEMGIPDHLTCLLRNLCACQEATVRTGHGTRLVPDRERGTSRLYIVTLLNLYAEYIMRNAGLEETQAGIKIAGRNINKLNIQKTKIMASGPIISWEIDEETVKTVADLIFLGSKFTAGGDCSHEIKRRLLLGRKVMTNLAYSKAETLLCQQRSV